MRWYPGSRSVRQRSDDIHPQWWMKAQHKSEFLHSFSRITVQQLTLKADEHAFNYQDLLAY